MQVVTYVDDGGSIERTETNFSLVVSAVASSIVLDPTLTFADNYEWTELNINANMTDLDGSETMTLTLEGANVALDETAEFQLNDGTSIDAVYDTDSNIWTLNDIAYDQINNIQISYHEYSDTVNVSAITVDGDAVLETAVTGSFSMEIAVTEDTGSDDDTILTDGDDAIDTGDGVDTIRLTAEATLDFTILENIERIDLSDNGDHNLDNLSLDDIFNMTDDNNSLEIVGDSGDSVTNLDTNGWTQTDSSDSDFSDGKSYTRDSDGSSLTLTVDDQIDTTGI
jgi:hypothetical protein